MPTERECVERERAAFRLGAYAIYGDPAVAPSPEITISYRQAHDSAATRYPIPKVTRPRVVRDPHAVGDYYWRCLSGTLYWSKERDGAVFTTGSEKHTWVVTPERVRLWADLLANPTEEVEE